MLRLVPVIVVCCLTPSWALAQGAPANTAGPVGGAPRTQFTVSAATAAVYQFPTTASPVVGNVPRGTVLDVTRELGSWVRVPWSQVQDGVAYVHVSMGSMTAPLAPVAATQRSAAASPQSTSIASAQIPGPPTRAPGVVPVAPPPSMYVPAPTHRLGLGASINGGSSLGYGATARAWRRDRLGIQVDLSHDSLTSATDAGHVSSTLFGASALYSMRDRLSDYYSLRPYIGGGAGLQRQALSQSLTLPNSSSNGLGVKTFGGVEVTFASVPQIGVSIEAGYQWAKQPYPGFDAGGFGVAAAGHWYFR